MKWTIRASSEGFALTRNDVTVTVPASLAGIKALHQMLLAWEPEQKIATPGYLTQAQLNELVKHFQPRIVEPQFKLDLGDLL